MTIRTDRNQTFDADGNLIAEEVVEVDITAEVESEARRTDLQQAISVLRGWSTTAAGVTVTEGNAVAVVQGITDNLAIFYDRFADLLVEQYGE